MYRLVSLAHMAFAEAGIRAEELGPLPEDVVTALKSTTAAALALVEAMSAWLDKEEG
jgi:hypothetical protein